MLESKSQLSDNANEVGGPKRKSILDGIITGLFGASTDEMTPQRAQQVEAQREQSRDKAYGLARNAATNPGEQFMGPPADVGNGNLLETIGKIFKMFSGGSGG